jgi:sialate O-acetylesterase
MMCTRIIFILSICVAFSGRTAFAEVRLHKLFGDHMVLQRDVAAPVWGWADPGEEVKVTIGGQTYCVKTDRQGQWKVRIQPMQAGGPHVMTVKGKNEIIIRNILFGEVWVCGGQSNMQYTLDMIGYREKKPSGSDSSGLRLFTVELDLDYLPKEDVKGGKWQEASPETIGSFSATAYFFGKYLHETLGVPIGLISSNLGATSIETWMSVGALKEFPQFRPIVNKIESSGKTFARINAELVDFRKTWDEEHYLRGPGIEQNWQDPATDVSDWQEIDIPNFWEYAGLPDHDGAVWFRKEFDLPEGFNGETFNIALNQIDDYDIAWVNGVKIGETFGSRNWRNYFFPANILKPKGNVLVVRVFDIGGMGGMYSAAFWGNSILNGTWKFKPGLKIDPAAFPTPEVVNGSFFTHPALLYNGNIASLMPFAIKGAIWYQGESNASRAEEYRDLLPAMIRDWRAHWGQGDFPFLIVQLANYKPEDAAPGQSEWAELREAQLTALSEPATAVATAIDIGDADDIHPRNKQDVGKRLGIAARRVAYGEDIVHSGPVFKSMAIEGAKVRIEFSSIGEGLVSKDKYGYLRGFSVAGADQVFHWAQAHIEGDEVVVYCEKVPQPAAVRYAWSDNPGPLDLYNAEDLPALPFRTDNWPLSTAGRKFVDDPHGF